MTDIDWYAVDVVVTQRHPMLLNTTEKRMAVRRLSEKMLTTGDWYFAQSTVNKLTAEDVATLLLVRDKAGVAVPCSTRSVQRFRDELPAATKRKCPSCREPMWVVVGTGIIEPHPRRDLTECSMSGNRQLSGLAAERPDLYGWVS